MLLYYYMSWTFGRTLDSWACFSLEKMTSRAARRNAQAMLESPLPFAFLSLFASLSDSRAHLHPHPSSLFPLHHPHLTLHRRSTQLGARSPFDPSPLSHSFHLTRVCLSREWITGELGKEPAGDQGD